MDSFTRQSEPTSLLEVHLYLQTMIKEGRRELMFWRLFFADREIIMCWQRKSCGSKIPFWTFNDCAGSCPNRCLWVPYILRYQRYVSYRQDGHQYLPTMVCLIQNKCRLGAGQMSYPTRILLTLHSTIRKVLARSFLGLMYVAFHM